MNHESVVQQENVAVPRLRRRCDSVHALHFGGVARPLQRQKCQLAGAHEIPPKSPLPDSPRAESSPGSDSGNQ